MHNLVLLAEAKADVKLAYNWYEEQLLGLGDEFLDSLDNCFSYIQKNPRIFKTLFASYRRALIKKFPYAVFYKITKEKIVIYSVFHCSQNPSKWYKRLN